MPQHARLRALLLTAVTFAACSDASQGNDGAVVASDGNDIVTRADAAPDVPLTQPDAGLDAVAADACRGVVCNGVCCGGGELCRHDQCLADLGRCAATGDGGADGATGADGGNPCPSDTWCDADGYCTPYGVPATHVLDPSCTSRAIPAPLVPATQCDWTTYGINGTPVVADLGVATAGSTTSHPSVIVAVNDVAGSPYTTAGHLYVFDGSTCALQQALTGANTLVSSAGTPAVGDLDGDGVPELVAQSGAGGLIAFAYDTTMHAWVTRWTSDMHPGPFTGAAVALADLTGDALPEVVLGGYVYDHAGHLLDGTLGELAYQGYSTPVVLADVDLDGVTELVGNNGVYQLDAAGHWQRESYDHGTVTAGFMAVADFGEFPGMRGDSPGRPELVLYATPNLIVRTVGGDTVFTASGAMLAGGGPPAVADLDGDGLPEIVVAGHAMMAFDPDCVPGGSARGGRCASGRTDGVMWVQTGLHDGSSAINGATVFDFDGDGRVEVVEADECFVRIFDGITGRARWSAPRVSCTFIEMPVVADTDGDLSAEIVVPANHYCGGECGLATGAPDPLLAGFACQNDAACPMGSQCVGSLCRCTTADQCGAGNACTAPLTADGMGNVCRSTFTPSIGLKIYGDARNRWVPSRPVWNQYAYSVTNVDDHGGIPAASSVRNNWQARGLNNYRQNVQGTLGDLQAPNLTIGPSPGGCASAPGGMLHLVAHFCNRGTGVAGAFSSVTFQAVAADGTRTALCDARTALPLEPGTCVDVSCDATRTLSVSTTIEALADANDQVQECVEADNRRVIYRPEDCIQ